MTHAPLMSLETELQALPLRRSQCWASYLGPKKSPTRLPKEFCTERQGALGTIPGPSEKTAAAFPSPSYCSLPHSGEFGGIRGVKSRFSTGREVKKRFMDKLFIQEDRARRERSFGIGFGGYMSTCLLPAGPNKHLCKFGAELAGSMSR